MTISKKNGAIKDSYVRNPITYDDDKPRGKYNTKPRTNEANSGEVRYTAVMTLGGQVYTLPRTATHLDVVLQKKLDIDSVIDQGWILANGHQVWRNDNIPKSKGGDRHRNKLIKEG